MDGREKRLLLSTCYGHFVSHFNMLVFPAVVLPLTGRLNLTMAEVLGLSFWMYLFFGITALPWGLVADRWGARPLMWLYYLGGGISGLAAAVFIDSPVGLTLSLGAIGLFSGIYHPVGLGLIAKEIKRVSLGMGFNGMFGNLGLATAPLLTGLVTWLWGPRAAYLVLGGVNLMGLGLMTLFPKTGSVKKQDGNTGDDNGGIGPFLILLIAMMLGGIAYRGATVIVPAYFELKNQGLFHWLTNLANVDISPNLAATTVVAVIYLIGMLGQYGGGRIADRFDPARCYLVFHAVTVPVVFMMAATTDLPLVALTMVYFLFLLGMQPAENTLVARLTPRRFHHSAYGTKFVLTFGVGSIAVKMVGAIQKGIGIEAVFPALGCVSAVLVGTIWLLILKLNRERNVIT